LYGAFIHLNATTDPRHQTTWQWHGYVLEPLVNDLLNMWEEGVKDVWMSRKKNISLTYQGEVACQAKRQNNILYVLSAWTRLMWYTYRTTRRWFPSRQLVWKNYPLRADLMDWDHEGIHENEFPCYSILIIAREFFSHGSPHDPCPPNWWQGNWMRFIGKKTSYYSILNSKGLPLSWITYNSLVIKSTFNEKQSMLMHGCEKLVCKRLHKVGVRFNFLPILPARSCCELPST
jgi:hypothetical protein